VSEVAVHVAPAARRTIATHDPRDTAQLPCPALPLKAHPSAIASRYSTTLLYSIGTTMSASQPHVQRTAFQLALHNFQASLSDKERRQFGATTLHDLNVAIETIQQKQMSERKLRAMNKLGRFLEGMKEYDKIVAVFLNTSEILAFVWVWIQRRSSDDFISIPMVYG
jgi:hypothetical protein